MGEAGKASNPSNPFEMIDALDKSANANQANPTSSMAGSILGTTLQSRDNSVPDVKEGHARVSNPSWPKASRYDYSVYNVKPEDQAGSDECLGTNSLAKPENEP